LGLGFYGPAGEREPGATDGQQDLARCSDHLGLIPSVQPARAAAQIFRAHQAEVAADVEYRLALDRNPGALQQRVPGLQANARRTFGGTVEARDFLVEERAPFAAE